MGELRPTGEMLKMELLQLYYFRTVASMEHMTKAAEALHVSQPSLSRAISALERELGVQLFHRTGRKITLNRCGKAFLAHVNRAITELETGRKEVAAMGAEGRAVVVSCVIPGVISELSDRFRQLAPNIPVRFRMDAHDCIPPLLRQGEIDFAISDLYRPGERTAGWIPLSDERLFALTASGAPMACTGGIHLVQLADHPLVLPESSAPIRTVLDYFVQLCGLSLVPTFEVNDVYAQLSLVEQGRAIGLIPSSALYDILSNRHAVGYQAIDNLRAVPVLDAAVSWHLGLSPLSDQSIDSAAPRLYQCCLQFFAARRQTMKDTVDAFCRRI